MRAALAQAETLSGIVVSDGPRRGDENRWRFVLAANGDFRLTGITLVENIAYDAATGVERSLNPSASVGGDTLFAAERRGIAPGPPDGGPATWLLPRNFGAVVRALLATDDPRVRETSYEGRPAWRLDIDVAPNAIVPELSGNRFEITVDRGTGIPVRVVERKDGAFLSEIRIEDIAVDAELGPDAFALEFPAGAEVLRSDDGFRRVELGEVEAAAGYAPLVPSFVPEGYELAEVAVAPRAAPTGAEAGNPESRMVVSLSYRRGLDQFLVTTRLAGVLVDGGPALPVEERWAIRLPPAKDSATSPRSSRSAAGRSTAPTPSCSSRRGGSRTHGCSRTSSWSRSAATSAATSSSGPWSPSLRWAGRDDRDRGQVLHTNISRRERGSSCVFARLDPGRTSCASAD